MRPRQPIVLPLFALALLVALILGVILGGSSGPSSPATYANPTGSAGFDGAALPGNVVAPDFTLTDQDGRSVSLSQYRGHVTVLTFLYSSCGAACVVIAQQIRGAVDELHSPAAVLIVSADPGVDTPARVSRFLADVSLTGRVHYLTGPPARLRKIWRNYHVVPAGAGRTAFAHFASVLLLDGRGHERVLYQEEQLTPESLAHDIGKLQSG
jgi:protein SCO1